MWSLASEKPNCFILIVNNINEWNKKTVRPSGLKRNGRSKKLNFWIL